MHACMHAVLECMLACREKLACIAFWGFVWVQVFVSRVGMARFCTDEYRSPTRRNQNNAFMHLTNYSINKENKELFIRSPDIHNTSNSKRLLSDVFKDLKAEGKKLLLLLPLQLLWLLLCAAAAELALVAALAASCFAAAAVPVRTRAAAVAVCSSSCCCSGFFACRLLPWWYLLLQLLLSAAAAVCGWFRLLLLSIAAALFVC